MARTVKEHEYADRRNDILDALQRLIFTKGYERLTLRDVYAELKISGGAFYHYFDSKSAVLAAFIARMQEEAGKPLRKLAHDPQLSATEKLQGFFAALDRLRATHQAAILELLRVWYTDDNALVRQRVDEAISEQRAPLLSQIVRQGVQEGSFTTPYPDQAGAVILSLVQGMGHDHAKLLLACGQNDDDRHFVETLVTTHAAYLEAVERALGAPAGFLHRADAVAVSVWVAAVRRGTERVV